MLTRIRFWTLLLGCVSRVGVVTWTSLSLIVTIVIIIYKTPVLANRRVDQYPICSKAIYTRPSQAIFRDIGTLSFGILQNICHFHGHRTTWEWNFKTLLLFQIKSEWLQSGLEFSFQKYCIGFRKFWWLKFLIYLDVFASITHGRCLLRTCVTVLLVSVNYTFIFDLALYNSAWQFQQSSSLYDMSGCCPSSLTTIIYFFFLWKPSSQTDRSLEKS